MHGVRRREFITLIGGAAAWPAHAQRPERMVRIGVFTSLGPDDPVSQIRATAITEALREFGWTVGRNVLIDWRWLTGDANRTRRDAADLVALGPDVLFVIGGPPLDALLQATRTIPIVFMYVVDPAGGGSVASLAHPGGNATGFADVDFSISTKWLELLKEIAPRVKRVMVFRTPSIGGGSQFGAIQGVAPALGVELRPVDPTDRGEIERAFASFVREPNGGVIVTGSAPAVRNRDLIITLVGRHRLPAVYYNRFWATGGGLLSYGTVRSMDDYRRAIGYVDRILKGEKPADLPVQAPTKFEMVINLKTAKAQGLEVPRTLLAIADEVIE